MTQIRDLRTQISRKSRTETYSFDPTNEVPGFAYVGGFREIKEELSIWAALAIKKNYEVRILVYGAPGTGKTYTIEALASEVKKVAEKHGKKFVAKRVSLGDLLRSSEYGFGSRVLQEVIESSRKLAEKQGAYVVLIFDDIETLLKKRGTSGDNVQEQTLQTLLGAFGGSGINKLKNGALLVFTITNMPQVIDEAAARRLSGDVIEFRRPLYKERIEILEKIVRKLSIPELMQYIELIARNTGGYTPSDLETLIGRIFKEGAKKGGLGLGNLKAEIIIDEDVVKEALKTHVPASLLEHYFYREVLDLSFDDFGGYPELKRKFLNLYKAIEKREIAEKYGINTSGAFLLVGPPGVGKSYFAKCFAGTINAWYLEVDTEILSKWVGESERKLKELLYKSIELSSDRPVVILIDEIDKLFAPDTSGVSTKLTRILYGFLDELKRRNANVIVIGTTNRVYHDNALIRSGRFEPVYVGFPDEASRKEIARIYLEKISQEYRAFDVEGASELIAGRTQHYTGADIEEVVRKASWYAFVEDRKVTIEDIERALNEVGPSVNYEMWKKFEEMTDGKV